MLMTMTNHYQNYSNIEGTSAGK